MVSQHTTFKAFRVGRSLSLKLSHRLEAIALKALQKLVQILPERWLPGLGKQLGHTIYKLGYRRRVVARNLEIAFGQEKSLAEREALAHKVYEHLGQLMVEILYLSVLSPMQIANYIKFEDLAEYQQALSEEKGILLATGHIGNWEISGAGVGVLVKPWYVAALLQKNPVINQFMASLRTRFHTTTVFKNKTLFRVLYRLILDKQMIGILTDLNVAEDDCFVDFFNKPASFAKGLPTLAIATQSSVVLGWGIRTGPLQHTAYFKRLHYTVSGDKHADIQRLAQQITAHFEAIIRQHPEQYLWTNKRWKTRPKGEQETIYDYNNASTFAAHIKSRNDKPPAS